MDIHGFVEPELDTTEQLNTHLYVDFFSIEKTTAL